MKLHKTVNKIEAPTENTVIINGVEYVPKGSVMEVTVDNALNALKGALREMVGGDVPMSLAKNPVASISRGFDKLPDEKKGNELAAMLYDKLPANLRHPARFRSFYTDFERDTGARLYDFHKERVDGVVGTFHGKYPYRKADSVFMVAEEYDVFEYVKNYEFTLNK